MTKIEEILRVILWKEHGCNPGYHRVFDGLKKCDKILYCERCHTDFTNINLEKLQERFDLRNYKFIWKDKKIKYYDNGTTNKKIKKEYS